jgi:hypothetical protein
MISCEWVLQETDSFDSLETGGWFGLGSNLVQFLVFKMSKMMVGSLTVGCNRLDTANLTRTALALLPLPVTGACSSHKT